jgi:predicted 3-demethylubiquinone-9 3-methyltransferase (glyoxalase superfamily)
MHHITPHLWFDKEAVEAAAFYTSVFSNSKVTNTTTITGTPSGDCDIVSFELRGVPFMAISAGPVFTPNPSISFMVNFDPSRESNAAESIDAAWNKLLDGGTVLMPLDAYPFSKRYGWVQDKYGFSWQLILTDPEGEDRPEIMPSLLFVQDKCGKAEESRAFYLDVFKNAPNPADTKPGALMHYGAGMKPNKEGTVMFSDFKLLDSWLVAMDGGGEHAFDFNEAISLIVKCENQQEIDYYWEKLSAVPASEQCGWLKDTFGVSWQIVPAAMDEMMRTGSKEQIERVTLSFLKMKKFDIAELQEAYTNA